MIYFWPGARYGLLPSYTQLLFYAISTVSMLVTYMKHCFIKQKKMQNKKKKNDIISDKVKPLLFKARIDFMPPTSEKFRGHIGLGLSIRPSVRP